MAAAPEAADSPKLLGSLKRLARTFAAILETRIEILETELQEERIRVARLVALAVVVAFLVNAALILGGTWLVIALWESNHHATIGVLAAVALGAAVAMVLFAWHGIKTRPKPFATTVAELRKDRARLAGRAGGEGAE
ncbi:MAG: phage holin family protein [Burkholderiales bacterium]|nr:phage holin family protein [Burkholderiales bacterium]